MYNVNSDDYYGYYDNGDTLMHYGTSSSGRFPHGSGENPHQHCGCFLARVNELKKQGITSEKDLAAAFNLTTTQYRAQLSVAKAEIRAEKVARAQALRDKKYSLKQIAEEMGYANDSSVRSLLNQKSAERMNSAKNTADFLKSRIDEVGMIDVGTGVENQLGIPRQRLDQALEVLKMQGYEVYVGRMPQVTNKGQMTTIKVVCPPGTEHKEIYDYDNVHNLMEYTSTDDGETFHKLQYPASMDSKRLQIRYAEEGGLAKDGLIELRRGVPDLSLGESHYAQVRILVDGDHYLKGMAVYSDDMPDGVDVVFNTNKKQGTPMNKVLKDIGKDPDNPFGSYISPQGQSYYTDKDGKQQLSLINKRSDEGEWADWSDKLPSQFLSKQPKALIERQLNLTAADRQAEFDEICSLTNPTVKRKLLESFADDCDAAAVHLKAAALPRQKYQVILPVPDMKDGEVYAPRYKNGETVALVRYPHGGTFEIPILKVNNKQKSAREMISSCPLDAIGINKKVADQLSGADFDGDTVMVIPCNSLNSSVRIVNKPPFEELINFDPKTEYGGKAEGTFKHMRNTQNEMGRISNLITDMTLKGAVDQEIIRAVKHSMVVIDAEKHGLDYVQSEKDNGIDALKKTYQTHIKENGKEGVGASTLISAAKSPVTVLKRRGQPWINEETGALEWERTNPKTGEFQTKIVREEYIDKKGHKQLRTQQSTRMAETSDARTLSTGTIPEELYADYANRMKSLANSARKEWLNTERLKYNPEARAKYKQEVASLDHKLNEALKNSPLERRAQAIANSIIKAKKQDYPEMGKDEEKKARQQALVSARTQVGAKRNPVEITDREWEAIQSGAIHDSKLEQILKHTDIDKLKERATPRAKTKLSDSKISRIKSMKALGYTLAEIADRFGISVSTVSNYLK